MRLWTCWGSTSIIWVINEDDKQYWPYCRSLGHTTSDSTPADFMLLIMTLWAWQFGQFSVHFFLHFPRPHLISLEKGMLQQSMLKALLNSRYPISNALPLSTEPFKAIRLVSHDFLFRNPCWVLPVTLLFAMFGNSYHISTAATSVTNFPDSASFGSGPIKCLYSIWKYYFP